MRPSPTFGALALLAVAWGLPLEAMMGHFPGHMLRHAVLVAVAPPLIVLGVPRLAGRMAIAALPATVLEAVLVWAWHLPGLHLWARTSAGALVLEQASFLGAGCLVWASAMASGQRLAGAGALLLTSMHMTLLGALLVLASRDLYAGGAAGELAAQQLGGIIMLAVATPAYLVGGLFLVARHLDDRSTA